MHSSRPRSRSRSSTRRRSRWLGVSRPTARAARRQRRGQLVEPVDARDLLDQVGLALHVAVAPGRHHATALARGSKPRRSRIPLDASASSTRVAEQLAHALAAAAARSRGGAGLRVHVDRARHHARPAQLHHQPRRQPLGGDRLLGMQLLLEARRRLAAQPERLRGAHDVRPDPGGRLHQHARGRRPTPRRPARP